MAASSVVDVIDPNCPITHVGGLWEALGPSGWSWTLEGIRARWVELDPGKP